MTGKPPMRLLVCGGRNFCDRPKVYSTLDYLHAQRGITCVIAGAARGADTLAADWAISRGVALEEYKADWDKHGKRAGVLCNTLMLDSGKPDGVLAFPRADGRWGTGTQNMMNQAFDRGLPISRVG